MTTGGLVFGGSGEGNFYALDAMIAVIYESLISSKHGKMDCLSFGRLFSYWCHFDAVSNAINLISPRLTYILTIAIIVIWICVEWVIKTRNPSWVFTTDSNLRIKELGIKPRLALLGAIILLWVPRLINSNSEKPVNPLNPIVAEIITSTSEAKVSLPFKGLLNDVIEDATKAIKEDPYNTRALLSRGQMHYTQARSEGGSKEYQDAINDFKAVMSINPNLADSRFGLGTVYYDLALFDLAKRGRYKIHQKGGFRLNEKTSLLERKMPALELFPDDRNKLVLQAALNEFQEGKKLRQDFHFSRNDTIVMFAPQDIDMRIRSIRIILGYEPGLTPDSPIINSFSMFLLSTQEKGGELLFDFDTKKNNEIRTNMAR